MGGPFHGKTRQQPDASRRLVARAHARAFHRRSLIARLAASLGAAFRLLRRLWCIVAVVAAPVTFVHCLCCHSDVSIFVVSAVVLTSALFPARCGADALQCLLLLLLLLLLPLLPLLPLLFLLPVFLLPQPLLALPLLPVRLLPLRLLPLCLLPLRLLPLCLLPLRLLPLHLLPVFLLPVCLLRLRLLPLCCHPSACSLRRRCRCQEKLLLSLRLLSPVTPPAVTVPPALTPRPSSALPSSPPGVSSALPSSAPG